MRPALLATWIAIGGCGALPSASSPAAAPGEPCRGSYAEAALRAHVASPALAELSGIAASHEQRGVLWAHNDSARGPRLFALDASTGELRGEWVLEGAAAVDWEDIALERVDGAPDRLWIGDVGDNAARRGRGTPRESVALLRVSEPLVPGPGEPPARGVLEYDAIVVRHPERPRDVEALTVDPDRGDLYLFAKEATGRAEVLVLRAPIEPGPPRVLERVGSIELGSMATAADISPDGTELVVRTYLSIAWWRRAPHESWPEALARPSRVLPHAAEPQGEAIAFAPDGRGYFTISEGERAPIWFFASRCD